MATPSQRVQLRLPEKGWYHAPQRTTLSRRLKDLFQQLTVTSSKLMAISMRPKALSLRLNATNKEENMLTTETRNVTKTPPTTN